MQTFVPFSSFTASANVLDYRRLGKQRVECKQLLSSLGYEIVDGDLIPTGKIAGWNQHPASSMWKGYELCLAEYQRIMIMEWIMRGYNNTMVYLSADKVNTDYPSPPWLGDDRIHSSHRSNLLRKDHEFYGKFNWTEPHDMPYQWPVLSNDGTYTLRNI